MALAIESRLTPYRFNGGTLDYSDDLVTINARMLSSSSHSILEVYAQWFLDEHGEGGEHTERIDLDSIEQWQNAVRAFCIMREGIAWPSFLEAFRAMFSPHLPSLTHADEVQRLRAENEALRDQLAAAEEVAFTAVHKEAYAAKLEKRIGELTELPNAIHALMTNPAMTPAVKVATYILGVQWHRRKEEEQDLHPEHGVRMNMTRAAEIAGVDTETLSSTARKVEEATGIWEYSTVHERYNEQAKRPLTHSYIKMDPTASDTLSTTLRILSDKACGRKAWTPREKLPLVPEHCHDCGEPTVYNETRKHCTSCDHILEEKKPVQVKKRAAPEISERNYAASDTPTPSAPEISTQGLTVSTSVPEISERQVRLPLVQRVVPAGEGVDDIVLPPEPPAKRPKRRVRQVTGSISHRLQGYAGGAD